MQKNYCFEPNKDSFKKLKLNIKKNFKKKYQIKLQYCTLE